MAKREAFVTLKDHKENFDSHPKCRLKVILDAINNNIRSIIKVNQWKNSQSVIEWFKNIPDKRHHTFVSFDVVEFYPSITEDLLDKAILWAKSFVDIPDEHVSIIKHARKSLLFNANKPCMVKRNNNSMFDVAIWGALTELKCVS
jgi:hypothetical protein